MIAIITEWVIWMKEITLKRQTLACGSAIRGGALILDYLVH